MKAEGATSRTADLPLDLVALDRNGAAPLHRQLYEHFRNLILRRVLSPRMRLPASRALANDLGISRNTVMAAYAQLESDGFIGTRQGTRPRIVELPIAEMPVASAGDPAHSSDAAKRVSRRGALMFRQRFQASVPGQIAFHPGTPEIRQFPFATWRRLLTRRLRSAGQDLFGYHSITGYPPLRLAIARYLAASRGVRCDPDQVVVTTGAQAALDLLARVLLDPGDTVWIEEPGYTGAQSACLAAGARLVALPVDETGWHLDRVAGPAPRLIYLTPSCQSPLGITMRMAERMQLIEIAQRRDAWIIEDDFDSEYRFGGTPLPAMQAIDPTGRILYVGTFAKTMFPALRIGFIVLPPQLSSRIDRAVFLTGAYAPLVLQGALSDFIEDGHFARHLRRTRRLYAERRGLFQELCGSYLGRWLEPLQGDAGIQTAWWLRPPWRDESVAMEAKRRSIVVTPFSDYYRQSRPRNGLVFGYAALDAGAMQRGLATMRGIFTGE